MVRSFIHHHVSDYAAWREVYDRFGDAQREHGVRAEAVHRGVDDPNDVTVTHDFAPKEREILIEGGLLHWLQEHGTQVA